MNCSWVVVATCVSGFVCLGRLGWKDQQNVAGSVAGAGLVILLVTLLQVFGMLNEIVMMSRYDIYIYMLSVCETFNCYWIWLGFLKRTGFSPVTP